MLLKMIAALIFGMGLGSFITSLLEEHKEVNKDYKIEILEDLLEVYEVHEKELKDIIAYYEDGMNKALEQNIDLKRRLNNGNPSRV